MKINEIITGLRKLSDQGSQYRRTVCRQAADALESALADLKKADTECDFCAHNLKDAPCDAADCDCSICKEDCTCKTCRDNSNWQWRGKEEQ